jgi:putative DNA primase/helicase
MLRGIFGNDRDGYGMESNFGTFIVSKYAAPDKPRNDIVRMRGKRIVAASENDDPNAKIDTALLKTITGDDDLSVRGNYDEEREFKPQMKIFLRMNNEPRILDDTDSIWDRVKKIVFKQQFLGAERDEHLTETLLAESSGILNWLLEGWALVWEAWQHKEVALPEPAEVKMATQEYRQTQSQVARFFGEHYRVAECECQPIPAADIYAEYTRWTVAQGEVFKKNLTAFGIELARHLAPYKNVAKKPRTQKKTIYWFGIEKLNAASSEASGNDTDELPF